jgi:hypothetical protein
MNRNPTGVSLAARHPDFQTKPFRPKPATRYAYRTPERPALASAEQGKQRRAGELIAPPVRACAGMIEAELRTLASDESHGAATCDFRPRRGQVWVAMSVAPREQRREPPAGHWCCPAHGHLWGSAWCALDPCFVVPIAGERRGLPQRTDCQGSGARPD